MLELLNRVFIGKTELVIQLLGLFVVQYKNNAAVGFEAVDGHGIGRYAAIAQAAAHADHWVDVGKIFLDSRMRLGGNIG